MLYTFTYGQTRILLYMKIPECGSLEPKRIAEYIFLIIQFKCLSIVKCMLLELPEQFHHPFLVTAALDFISSQMPDECSLRLPNPPTPPEFLLLDTPFNTLLSSLRRHKLRVFCTFLNFFIISTLCMCAKYYRQPVVKTFCVRSFVGLRIKTLLLKNAHCVSDQ
jgi:hypothetical protein